MKTKSRLALLLCGTALTGTATAADPLCEVDYIIQHSWQTGAVHRVHLTYNGPETTGWKLRWSFPAGEQIDSIFNVTHAQEGQDVTVENLLWNARLSEGREYKFGFNVRNPSGEVPDEFHLNDQRCNVEMETPETPETPDQPEAPDDDVDDTPDGTPEDNPGGTPGSGGGQDGDDTPEDGQSDDGSDAPDEVPGDQPGDDNIGDDANAPTTWSLDQERSYLGFVTTKNTHTVESHHFGTFSGSVSESGTGTLSIDLNSVETGVDRRNQRVRDMLFNTSQTPTASVTVELGNDLVRARGLSPGEVMTLGLPVQVQISGVSQDISSQLRVQRLGDQRFVVSSSTPLIIMADQFGLEGGIASLQEIAGLNSLSIAVPVDFALFFEADEPVTP